MTLKKFSFKWRYLLAGSLLALVLISIQKLLSPGFLRADHSAPVSTCKTNLVNLATALEMYSSDHQGKYPQNLNQLVPNYIRTLPECPGSLGYFAEFGPGAAYNSDGYDDYYFLQCTGDAHRDSNLPRNYPQYDGIQGLIDR